MAIYTQILSVGPFPIHLQSQTTTIASEYTEHRNLSPLGLHKWKTSRVAPLSTTKSINNRQVSFRTGPLWNGRRSFPPDLYFVHRRLLIIHREQLTPSNFLMTLPRHSFKGLQLGQGCTLSPSESGVRINTMISM